MRLPPRVGRRILYTPLEETIRPSTASQVSVHVQESINHTCIARVSITTRRIESASHKSSAGSRPRDTAFPRSDEAGTWTYFCLQ